MTVKLKTDHVAADETFYRYTEPAPRGVKLTLLTVGNVQVTGEWSDRGGYKAWAPLIKRDKEQEKALGIY